MLVLGRALWNSPSEQFCKNAHVELLAADANVTFSRHKVHTRSAVAVGAVDWKKPTPHTGACAVQATALLVFENEPSTHAVQARSVLTVGGSCTRLPGPHVETLRQLVKFSLGAKVRLASHAVHTRSLVAVPRTPMAVPGAHPRTAMQAAALVPF